MDGEENLVVLWIIYFTYMHTHAHTLHLFLLLSDFAEKLFKKLDRSTERFEARLLIMNLISRLIGVHQVSMQRVIVGIDDI